MQRICTSLAKHGFEVTLAGRKLKNSKPIITQPYRQRRLSCLVNRSIIFYAFFNIRLFSWLLTEKADIVCAIDLDTILACYFASKIKRWKRVYDAHELFTEQKEIMSRPLVYKLWLMLEKYAVPHFQHGYTVNDFIVKELNRRYGVHYITIKNMPVKTVFPALPSSKENTIIYQGAVNEGRSFETLIPAMKFVQAKLLICGDGNFFAQTKALIEEYMVGNKVELKGLVSPDELKKITPTATIAIMLFEQTGLNQYHSLANRFFDYIMAGVPQVCINYPEYKAINDIYGVAYMIEDTKPETIADAFTTLLNDKALYQKLKANCLKARKVLNWESEEKKLIAFYKKLTN
ncbi:glycosyltransferase family 4 protein [Ilyomonas limi]|uniref:Glycosyltransferase family 4 protein n=2 Tax=Ilyomonas limi TaxID=2575867 RepID=A0A4U3KWD8_9BACT|nr:glycosyltransferase family 4 protein [Ilyomonas limi]